MAGLLRRDTRSGAPRRALGLVAALLAAMALPGVAIAQACRATLRGVVVDEHDGQPLAGASIFVEGLATGGFADDEGRFALELPCGLRDTVAVSHLGCATVRRAIVLAAGEMELRVALEHHSELLDAIEVHAHRNRTSAADIGGSLTGEQLDRSAGSDLATVVAELPGVRALSTGASVARPVVDGLGGARLQVIQNGTALASQDWGDEHAPEIDPFAAAAVQLARAGAGLRFGASSTGATLVIDDAGMPEHARPHGQALALAGSNQAEAGLGLALGQALGTHWGYRAQAYGHSAADARAPDYVLSNTGARRGSGAARVFYRDSALQMDLGYRGFAQETGILRAAHIGNTSDFERALASPRPLVVAERTRAIDAPRQAVVHHWLSATASYRLAGGTTVGLDYSAQRNARREYDLRRGGRSARASVDLALTTHNARAVVTPAPRAAWATAFGAQAVTATNRNVPGTGVRPLIPHYDASTAGAFAEGTRLGERASVEVAARLDYRATQANYFTGGGEAAGLTVVERREWLGAASAGWVGYLPGQRAVRARLAYGSRAPNPAERFADGVHHALAVIERGDTSLRVEHGLKATLGYGSEGRKRLEWHASAFVQAFRGFIYARQAPTPELTIRGAFPVLTYRQGDALLGGVDLDAHLRLGHWQVNGDLDALCGRLRGGEALPDIAPWRVRGELAHSRALRGTLKDWRLAARVGYVARQRHLPATLLAPPPPAYALVGLEAGGHFAFRDRTLGVHLTVDNLLDARYRDYLDRLRFYADRPGRDIQLRLLYDF